MVPLHPEKSKSSIPFTLISAWSNFFGFIAEKTRSFLDSILSKNRAKEEIKKLEAKLREIPNVEDVLIIPSNVKNLHETTFKILANVDFYAAREIEEKALDLVIDTEWELCDFYKTENWHFRTQVINNADFSFVKIQ
ncbi:hypothetical protein IQ231_19330 [Cuspidothrix issatschenkoi LEGE 03284]|jgi:hypothetical protein|uniref:hypothetical protein n=1 Tax=Cuspidothrix issatschenkoi TaxID=230752 RepID=UPI00187E6B67|nr:hypothetical protein [Cuspidothrix issatschenkoi]MBE9233761.1 hypothetical protein [Cuspidothrix issatschenkoi LEGE 03284]